MAGPTKRTGGSIERDEHGRVVHTFRQSTLGELDNCLEKGRLTLTGEMPRWETDAASVGTAMHAGIEAVLEELRDEGEVMPLSVAQEIAQLTFTDQMALPNFMWIQNEEDACRRLIDLCVEAWYREVLPGLEPVGIEIPFDGLVIYEDDERVIKINGTMDYLDGRIGLADWKTAGSAYKAWEKERWAIQPTVYTLAARLLGIECAQGDVVPFRFVVMLKSGNKRVQLVDVYRHAGDWRWLVEKTVAVARLIEADLQVWPKNDNHALCSPKWCPVWDSCKGNNYAEGWPKLNAPSADAWVHMPAASGSCVSSNDDIFANLGGSA